MKVIIFSLLIKSISWHIEIQQHSFLVIFITNTNLQSSRELFKMHVNFTTQMHHIWCHHVLKFFNFPSAIKLAVKNIKVFNMTEIFFYFLHIFPLDSSRNFLKCIYCCLNLNVKQPTFQFHRNRCKNRHSHISTYHFSHA